MRSRTCRQFVLCALVLAGVVWFGCNVIAPPANTDSGGQLAASPLDVPLLGSKEEAEQSDSGLPNPNSVDLYVSDANGDDDDGEGTQESPFKTIQRAANELTAYGPLGGGASINVDAGTYPSFAISNLLLHNDSSLDIRRWNTGDSNSIIVDGGVPPGDANDANDPNAENDAIKIVNCDTVILSGISIVRGSTGLWAVNSTVLLNGVNIDDTSSSAVRADHSIIATADSLNVGAVTPCEDGLSFVDSEILTGFTESPTALNVTVRGDGARSLLLHHSTMTVVPSVSLTLATAGDSCGTSLVVTKSSSLELCGALSISTPNSPSGGIEISNASSLVITSPEVNITGSGSGGTVGLSVTDSSAANLWPSNPNFANDPNALALWTIRGYGRAGISSRFESTINMNFITSGSLTLTGTTFGTGAGQFQSIAGVWAANGSMFEDYPGPANARGVIIVRDFQTAVMSKVESLCILHNVVASVDPNKLQGSNNTTAFLVWDSFLTVDNVLPDNGSQYTCEGISQFVVAAGPSEAGIGIAGPNAVLFAGDPNYAYISASNNASLTIVSSDPNNAVTFTTNDPNGPVGADTLAMAFNDAQLNLSGMRANIVNFSNPIRVHNGSTCRAFVNQATRTGDDPSGTTSRFALAQNRANISLQFAQGMGDATYSWNTLCSALDGSQIDLLLWGNMYKYSPAAQPNTSAMIDAGNASVVRVTGGRLDGGGDPNTPGNLVLPNPSDPNYRHFETREASSILGGMTGTFCWGFMQFDGSYDPNQMHVTNGASTTPGFDATKDCYVTACD